MLFPLPASPYISIVYLLDIKNLSTTSSRSLGDWFKSSKGSDLVTLNLIKTSIVEKISSFIFIDTLLFYSFSLVLWINYKSIILFD